MPSVMRRAFSAPRVLMRLLGLSGATLTLGIFGCHGDEVTSASRTALPSGPSYAVSPPPSQSFFIPPPSNSIFYLSTGIIVPQGFSARMRITGLVNLDPHPQCPGAQPGWIGWDGYQNVTEVRRRNHDLRTIPVQQDRRSSECEPVVLVL
jgi:hypothetical protein